MCVFCVGFFGKFAVVSVVVDFLFRVFLQYPLLVVFVIVLSVFSFGWRWICCFFPVFSKTTTNLLV